MGPGKPYWKRPAGSTGGMMALEGKGDAGCGGEGVVGVGGPTTVVDGDAETLRSREEKRAAAAAAPVSADTPATTAKVVFDIWTGCVKRYKSRGRGQRLYTSYTSSQHRVIKNAILVGKAYHDFRVTRDLRHVIVEAPLQGCVETDAGRLAGIVILPQYR